MGWAGAEVESEAGGNGMWPGSEDTWLGPLSIELTEPWPGSATEGLGRSEEGPTWTLGDCGMTVDEETITGETTVG
jgi:hypothetical protein